MTSTLPAPRSLSEQPLCPEPPKHVGSFARSHANSETSLPRSTESVCPSPPSKRRCSGAITASGTSLNQVIIQGVCNTLAHEHPRLREADVVMLIASESLDALHRRQGFLHPLIRLCGRLSRLAQAYTQYCMFAAEPRRLTPCRLRGVFKLRFRTSVGSSWSSNCSNPGAHTFVATESVTCVGQGALDIVPRAVERCGRPDVCHVVLKANPREPSRSHRVRLGEGKLQSKHEHNLHGPRTLPSAPCRAVQSPTIVASVPKPRVARLPSCCADRSKLRACAPRRLEACRPKRPSVSVLQINW